MVHKKKRILPFVSICTPTFNRRPFIGHMIKCFEHQDYPKDKMEWIIIDDGTDKIEDLVSHIPQVKYFKYETKMRLGEKRNLMHTKTKGEIIVYMDDDDYYPPERVSHAVTKLLNHPSALCAGTSEIYIYFKHINKMYQFGPYGEKHATAGTFAFRKRLLDQTSYDNNAALAEEKHFLKNYTIPFVQLDPIKTILVFSHIHNTFDKKKLLADPTPLFTKESWKPVTLFIKNPEMRDFYTNQIENLLISYEPGNPSMKPDVIEETNKIFAENRTNPEKIIKLTNENGEEQNISAAEAVEYIKQQIDVIANLNHQIKLLTSELEVYKIEKNTKVEELDSSALVNSESPEFINQVTSDYINQLCIA